MATRSEIHTIGGVNLDKDPRALKPNELSYAQDNDLFGDEGGKDLSYAPLPSSELIYTIPAITQQYQYTRLKFDSTVTSYMLTIKDASGANVGTGTYSFNLSGLGITTIAQFVTAIDNALIAAATSWRATYDSSPAPTGEWFALALYQGAGTPSEYTITQVEVNGSDSTEIPIYTLQDAFNPLGATSGQMSRVASVQLKEYEFLFAKSSDGLATSFGYAYPNDNNVWTYTPLFISSQLTISTTEVVEIQAEELASNQYAFYYTDNTGKPRVIYVPTTLGAYSALKYSMDAYTNAGAGMQSLESIDIQTSLQVACRPRVEFVEQLETGGLLESGTYYYYVQAGIGRDFSEWSYNSQPVPVFKAGTSGPSAGLYVAGDKTPAVSSKSNKVRITGIDPRIYSSIKLGCLLNQGGAYSAFVIGEFDVTGFEFDIVHTGNETGLLDLDPASLPPVQPTILKSKNLQIKRNILNLANVELAYSEGLEAVVSNVTLGQYTDELDNVGVVDFSVNPVFRVSGNFEIPAANEQTILFDNDSTDGNFNTSSFNLVTNIFTVPSTGNYEIDYNVVCFQGPVGPPVVTDVYVVNLTTSQKLMQTTNASSSQVVFFKNKQILSLVAGQQIALKYFVFSYVPGRTINASFSVNQQVGSYSVSGVTIGEYQLPSNVANKTGYMINETYPFFFRAYFKNGYVSDWQHIGNYQFNDGSNPASRLGAALTTTSGTVAGYKVLSYGLTIDGMDISSIKDDIFRIEIGRGICNPTILGTGIFIPASSTNSSLSLGGSYNTGYYTGAANGALYGANVNDTNDLRYFGFFICPDWMTGDVKPEFQNGDYLINYGQMENRKQQFGYPGAANKFGGSFDMNGYPQYIGSAPTPASVLIEDAQYVAFNTDSRVLKNDTASLYGSSKSDNSANFPTLAVEGMAMTLGSKITALSQPLSTTYDFGMYYVQYVRPNANQYNIKDVKVVSCNAFVEITDSTPNILPQIQVMGGDTYTQKTYTKVMYNAKNPLTTTGINGGALTSFVGYYSQNKINQQLRYVDKTFTNLPFPFGNSLDNYWFGVYEANEQFQIDKGYDWYAPLNVGIPYNDSLPNMSKLHSRIYYSVTKPVNSVEDWYRVFLPNNFKDLPAKDGPINGLFDVTDAMFAIQAFAVSVLPYNSDVALSASDGSLYIGSGGVYAQREVKVSTYGASLKSGTLKAENGAGNVQVYWYSDNAKAFMRYGGDGVKSLSEQDGWRTWFLNYTNFANNEFDIVLGYDRNRREIFVTFRCYNQTVSAWSSATAYVQGDVVRYGATNKYKTFEQLPDFYVALQAGTNKNPFDNPTYWEYIQPTDSRYYNYFTAVYNERANFFKGFFSLLPTRYFLYNGRPTVNRGRAPINNTYDLFGGTGYLQWLNSGGTYKQGEFILEWVTNKQGLTPERFKWLGMQVGMDHDVNNNPSVVVQTETQITSMDASDLEYRNGQLGVGIYPDANDEPIIGEYAKVKLSSQSYYRIYALVTHLYDKFRTILK